MTGPKTVRVWKDPEWHEDGPAWIVSIDYRDANGDEQSDTKSTHETLAAAIESAERLAEENGLLYSVHA